jgi:hypothetical protein
MSDFIRTVYQGLKEADALGRSDVATSRAEAIRKAALLIDKDAILTHEAIDKLALEPGVRAQLIIALILDRYPDEVGSHLRAPKTLAGVFTSMLELDDESVLAPDSKDDIDEIPEYIASFIEELYAIDPMNANTGDDVIGEHKGISLKEVDEKTLSMHVAFDDEELACELEVIRTETGWKSSWSDGSDPAMSMEGWDLNSLRSLVAELEPRSSLGARDPLLRIQLSAREQEEGNLLPDLITWLKDQISQKEHTRREHLDQIDGVLRENLGTYRVGRRSKKSIDATVEALMARVWPKGAQ